MTDHNASMRRRTVLGALTATAASGCVGGIPLVGSEPSPGVSWGSDCLTLDASPPEGWLSRRVDPAGTGTAPEGFDGFPDEERWRRPLDASGSIVRVGTTVFVGIGGGVAALDAASGDVVWRNDRIGAAPSKLATNGESVFVLTDEVEDARVVALDAANGGQKWEASPYSDFGQLLPLADGVVVLQDDSPLAVGLDGATGESCLTYEYGVGVHPTGAADGRHLYVTNGVHGGDSPSHSLVLALAPDGSIAWRTEVEFTVDAGLAVREGTVYALTTADLVALSAADGSEEWRRTHGLGGHEADRTLAVTEERVILHLDGSLAAYDRETGDELWSLADPISGDGIPRVVGDSICLLDQGRKDLYRFDAGTGAALSTPEIELSAMAFDDRAMYGLCDGFVARFE